MGSDNYKRIKTVAGTAARGVGSALETAIEGASQRDLDARAQENIITRQISRVIYAIRPERVILDRNQYCLVQDARTGDVETVEGPARKKLGYDEHILIDEARSDGRHRNAPHVLEGIMQEGVRQKIVVPENGYAVISSPRDAETGDIRKGEKEVRHGPASFALHHGEKLEFLGSEHVLTKYEALLVRVNKGDGVKAAGDQYLVVGPKTFIPGKDETVLNTVRGVPLSDTDGIYVQDRDTGDARLVVGTEQQEIYFLQPNEQLFHKELTRAELEGLGLKPQQGRNGVRILTRQAANDSFLEDTSNALCLELEDNEVVLIQDGSDQRIERGPKTTFLGPYERPKVLNLSGGRPIEPGALNVSLLKLGPDFIYDRVTASTKDNARLNIDVTYKWRINLEDSELHRAFSLDDFVGYTAETLSSEIRTIAAKHDFEDFHANALEYITAAIFGDDTKRRFDENGLEIFGIDVTGVTPDDARIAEKLNDAIKQNMDVYCNKIVLTATLEAERQEVEGKRKIAAERKDLITAEAENERLATQAKDQTHAESLRARAKAQADAKRIEAEADAEATRVTAAAEAEAEKTRLSASIEALTAEGAQTYVSLQRAEAFKGSEKLVVVPTDTKVVLPFAKGGEWDE